MSVDKNIKQSERLWILLLYLIGLLVTSKIALYTWLPPSAEKGIWFYSALAALLLGNLIVTPYFTKPADAISYAVASFIALLAVNVWSSTDIYGFDRLTWSLALAYVLFVLATSILAIILKDTDSTIGNRLSRLFFDLSASLGNPRKIFSVVLIFALLTYHRHESREFLTIGMAWVIFVILRPLESALSFLRRAWCNWRITDTFTRLGKIVGHETPNIVLIRESEGQQAKFGDVIIARSDYGNPDLALAVDHVGFADGRWLRAIHLFNSNSLKSVDRKINEWAYTADNSTLTTEATDLIKIAKDKLIGIVARDTTVGRLNIEIIRNDLSIYLGNLVEVMVGNKKVLYQIIDGITREEIIQQKNTRGFVRAEAKKIGTWDYKSGNFESAPWLPQPNEPVYLTEKKEVQIDKDAIGHFPGTHYSVSLNLDTLVTHNAAILGILGVGKSFLALELVERMIDKGIKIICLDLTDQYARELVEFYDGDYHEIILGELSTIGSGGRNRFMQNVEEGGSIQEFSIELKGYIEDFLNGPNKLLVFNPAGFEVWRQDSRLYPSGLAAMATLTPCEITKIITETTLSVLQEQGMSDEARCCLIYEEAHSLIPEWGAVASEGDKSATNGTAKAILQGRKFGLGCIVITQRTANVTKSILNQCNTVFAMRVFDATGMEFLSNYIGDDYADVLSSLEDRQAVVFGRASSCCDPVLIRLNDRDKFIDTFRREIDNEKEELHDS